MTAEFSLTGEEKLKKMTPAFVLLRCESASLDSLME